MTIPAPPRLHVLHVPGADPRRDECVATLRAVGNTCVHEDPERSGVMGTFLAAVRCAQDDTGSWTTIVQDDIALIPGWQQHYERAVRNSPRPILGMTHLGTYGEKAAARGAAYGVGPYLTWGAAIAYHRSILPRLLTFIERVHEAGYAHDDVAVAAFAKRECYGTAMTARAIFDLIPASEVRSLLGHHGGRTRLPSLTIRDEGPDWREGRVVPVQRGRGQDLIDVLDLIGDPS